MKTLLTFGNYINGMNDNACTQCGRKVGKNPLWVHVTTDCEIIHPDSESPDSQGCWPVGSECAKAFAPGVLFKMGA